MTDHDRPTLLRMRLLDLLDRIDEQRRELERELDDRFPELTVAHLRTPDGGWPHLALVAAEAQVVSALVALPDTPTATDLT